jgi:DNA-binding transcriptional ArsR family regulator
MKICSCKSGYAGDMGHAADSRVTRTSLDATTAKSVATTLQALATPSRLLILATLREGPATVGTLSLSIGMEQSAVSHQLRLLRNLGLVEGERHGRNIVYSLYDDHVAELIDQAVYHTEHLHVGAGDKRTGTREGARVSVSGG